MSASKTHDIVNNGVKNKKLVSEKKYISQTDKYFVIAYDPIKKEHYRIDYFFTPWESMVKLKEKKEKKARGGNQTRFMKK